MHSINHGNQNYVLPSSTLIKEQQEENFIKGQREDLNKCRDKLIYRSQYGKDADYSQTNL